MHRQLIRHQAIKPREPACCEICWVSTFNQIKIGFFKGYFIKKCRKLPGQ